MKTQYSDPPIAQFLFGDTRLAFLWLVVRVYLGWQWLHAGWGKIHSPLWVGDTSGQALSGFIQGALQKTGGAHPDVQGWYAFFLQNSVLPHASVWAKIIAYGEVIVGVALILGLFTGVAAFFGLFMNFNFLLAGTVSINPILFVLGLFILFAWKVAGYFGLDRYILPLLGTPWKPGKLFSS